MEIILTLHLASESYKLMLSFVCSNLMKKKEHFLDVKIFAFRKIVDIRSIDFNIFFYLRAPDQVSDSKCSVDTKSSALNGALLETELK